MKLQSFAKAGLGLAIATALVMPARAGESSYPDISQPALTKAIKAKQVTLLDANGTDSWKSGHIPGALNFETVKGNLKSKLPTNKKALIVAYCGSPMCGAYKAAADAAKSLGYTNVKHFSAGISGWKKSGAAVQKG
jgi:rhodanese-related sulfurtransferase